MKNAKWVLALSLLASFATSTALAEDEYCPNVYHKGVIDLDINPAFLHVDQYDTPDGGKADGLTISSFYNTTFSLNPQAGVYVPNFPPFAADQVGRIMYIDDLDPEQFDFGTDYEKLTDLYSWMPATTWPNQAARIPDGVLPFEAVVVPQGFHPVPTAGRLTIINLESPTREEYIVHEGTLDPSYPPGHPLNAPRFYHEALFYDMDGDGLKDIVTVRSGFKLITSTTPPTVVPPFSELVYFRNPGAGLDANAPWEEVVLYGGMFAGFMGPDIHLAMHDFDGDGVPEIVATHFFSGDDPTKPQPTKGKIAIYGAPFGGSWAQVNAAAPYTLPRVKVISESQGFPFAVEIVDLNGDGKKEVLATNHQFNCTSTPGVAGQVYAVLPPESGDVFGEDWAVRVLLDNILPQPTPQGATGMRMAPGHAISFYPKEEHDRPGKRPWILISGDEAGKVWMMKPEGDDFDYQTAVVFDINDYYGEGTTQTFTPQGTTISTIGRPALRYDADDDKEGKTKRVTEIYIPVFEAQDIHVLSFNKDEGDKKIACPADITYECPVADPGGGTGEECIMAHCAAEAGACMQDPDCAGWMACIQECGDDVMACPTFCGLYYDSPLAIDFTNCSMDNGCFAIDFSSFEECVVPQGQLHNLDGMEGTWWFVASSGEEHLFDPECQRLDTQSLSDSALSVDFSVPLTDNGVEKMCGTPGTYAEQADGSINVVYDNFVSYHEDWYIVHKSTNTALVHMCFASEGSSKDYGTVVFARMPLGDLPADEYQALDDAVMANFGVSLDWMQPSNIVGCPNGNI